MTSISKSLSWYENEWVCVCVEGGKEGGRWRKKGREEGRETARKRGMNYSKKRAENLWVRGSVTVTGFAGKNGTLPIPYAQTSAGPSTPPEIPEAHCHLSYRALSENNRGMLVCMPEKRAGMGGYGDRSIWSCRMNRTC